MVQLVSLTVSFVANMAVFTGLWLLYRRTNRLAVIDLFWGGGFVLIGAVHGSFFATTLYHVIFMLALSVWAARLTAHLASRTVGHKGQEGHHGEAEHQCESEDDPRYEAMKMDGGARFRLTSLWKVFWLQAVIQFGLALPIHVLFLMQESAPITLTLYGTGMVLFAAGLAIEVIADRQLTRFKAQNPPRHQLLTSGLWAWSRHPNHFGEALLWFGLTLMVVAVTGAWWTLLAPLALTLIMVKLSGVAMLDDHLSKTKEGFAAYRENTSAFFPLPPRRRLEP